MTKPPTLSHEAERLARLRSFDILDTPAEQDFDDLTALASQICDTPVSMISLVDDNRQWFKSKVGIAATETPRDMAFCAHAIAGKELFVVGDALADERFANNPLVTGDTKVRFYAGAPLTLEDGQAMGTLCVIDHVPRELTEEQRTALTALSRQAVSQMRLRESVSRLTDVMAEVTASERFARSTLDALSAQIAILDGDGLILAVNEAWRDFAASGIPSQRCSAPGSSFLAACDQAGRTGSPAEVQASQGLREIIRGDRETFEMESAWGEPQDQRWFVMRVSRFPGAGPTRVVVAYEDVTQRRNAEDRLRFDSLHDGLTGLPNRALFRDRVLRCLERSRSQPNHPFAVLFLDLDRFKVVNDSLGHAAGDLLLTTISSRLSACLRADVRAALATPSAASSQAELPVVARLGGDEFTILFDGLGCPQEAERIANRLLAAVCRPVQFGAHTLEVTASIGIVLGGPNYASEMDVLRDADAAMYVAKGSGKNRSALFDDTLHAGAMVRLRLESDLRRAVERNELLLHYQPIVSLDTRELLGFEALIRWQREGKLVSPIDFIPIAEETGIIVPIGTWVIRQACSQLASWHNRITQAQKLTVSINLSRRQLADPSLLPTLTAILKETGVDPACIKLEITESVVMDDPEGASRILSALKATGVRLSMDDFGTGYSSLSCLRRFPLDELKVDRSFVTELEGQRDAAAVLTAIVDLAHNLNLVVVAEGLETEGQVAFLQAVNCDRGQGYFFSRPLHPDAAEAFITCRNAVALAA